MKKRTIGIHAAVAVLLGAASLSSFAGVATGLTKTIATQAVVSNSTALVTGSVAYSTQVPLPIGSAFLKVSLGNGAKFLQAAGGALVTGTITMNILGGGTVTLAPGTVSADQTAVVYPIPVTIASVLVGSTFTFKALSVAAGDGAVTNAGYLATAGSVLPVTMSIGSSATVPADIDTAASGNVITTVNGLTYTSLASSASNFTATVGTGGMAGAAIEAKKINVATGTGVAFDASTSNTAGTTLLNFGGFRFADVAGALAADAATAFNLATNYPGTWGAVLSGNFGAALGTGGSVFLSTSNSCAGALATATVTGGGMIATFAGVPYQVAGTPVYACMQVNTPGNAIVIPSTQPSNVVTLTGGTAATANYTTTAASLYNLTTNGASTLVRSYVPAAAVGYTSFLRLVNTGSVTAAVSVAVVDETTGVAGTSAVVATLAAGGSVTLTSAQVEAALGGTAIAGTKRPTLRVTAPGAVTTQSFILTNANGNFSNVSASE